MPVETFAEPVLHVPIREVMLLASPAATVCAAVCMGAQLIIAKTSASVARKGSRVDAVDLLLEEEDDDDERDVVADREMEQGATRPLAKDDEAAVAVAAEASSESHPSSSCVCSSTRPCLPTVTVVLDREEDDGRDETCGILDGPASDCTVLIMVGCSRG